jgi:hypothetical protein
MCKKYFLKNSSNSSWQIRLRNQLSKNEKCHMKMREPRGHVGGGEEAKKFHVLFEGPPSREKIIFCYS